MQLYLRNVGFFILLGIFSSKLPQAEEKQNTNKADVKAQTQVAVKVSYADKVVVIPIKGVIVPDSKIVMALVGSEVTIDDEAIKALTRAEEDGARMVVLEIDSPGGVVTACEKICARLLTMPESIPVKALITKQAISGGSMVATACREIIMVSGTTIGDCEPHTINSRLPDYMREKVESPIRARMRANAQANGYPAKILEAMVTKSFELYEIKFKSGAQKLLYKDELELLEKQIKSREIKRKIVDRKILVKSGRLLTLTAKEALECKLAKEVVKTTSDFYQKQGVKSENMVRFEQKVKKYNFTISLKLQMVLAFFLILGISGIIVESQVPGFGLPGIIGVIGFTAFFSTLAFYDRASVFEISLFVIGITLILLEIFIIPGFGIPGIAGILCVFSALVLSYLPAFSEGGFSWKNEVATFFNILGFSSLGSIIITVLSIKYLPSVSCLSHLFLPGTLKSGEQINREVEEKFAEQHQHDGSEAKAVAGMAGKALTVLRPSGKMQTESGQVLDVVSGGMIIEVGKEVKIVDINGLRIEVVEVD